MGGRVYAPVLLGLILWERLEYDGLYTRPVSTHWFALGGWSSLTMVQRYAHHRPERAVELTTRMLAARRQEFPQSSPTPMTRGRRNA